MTEQKKSTAHTAAGTRKVAPVKRKKKKKKVVVAAGKRPVTHTKSSSSSAPSKSSGAHKAPVKRRRKKATQKKSINKVVSKRRRNTISGRRRTRSAYILYYISIPAIVLAIIAILSVTVLFNIKEIKINGNIMYQSSEVISASGIEIGDNLFTVSEAKTSEKLTQDLPYIESIEIKRSIPSTLTVKVTEAVPAYVLESSGTRYILSSKFKVLGVLNGEIPSEYVLIKGMEISKCEVGSTVEFADSEFEGFLYDTINAIDESNLTVRGIEFTETGILRLNYEERIIVDLGSPTNLSHKLRLAANVIQNQLAATDKGIVYISGENTGSFRIDTGNLGLDYLINSADESEDESEEQENEELTLSEEEQTDQNGQSDDLQ